jgi:ammonium transporter, Amt family
MILTQVIYKKIDLTLALNGALAGLVSITAGPLDARHFLALDHRRGRRRDRGVRGAAARQAEDRRRRRRDPAHLVAGIWGTLAVVPSSAAAAWSPRSSASPRSAPS